MTWSDVITGLTGPRLAALDELYRHGERSALRIAMNCERYGPGEIVDALWWLCGCFLAEQTAPGIYAGRNVEAAAEHFEKHDGPREEFMQEQRNIQPTMPNLWPSATTAVAPAPAPPAPQQNLAVYAKTLNRPLRPRVHDYQVQFFPDL